MSEPPATNTGERVRRSPTLSLRWTESGLVAFNWMTRRQVSLPPAFFPVLDALSDWRSIDEVTAVCATFGAAPLAGELLDLLTAASVVQREGTPARDLSAWAPWQPEAAAFHFATKDGEYPDDLLAYDAELRVKAVVDPPPAPCKKMPGPRVALPPATAAPMDEVLGRRRTWRNFGPGAVPLAALSRLLFQTFGVQAWGHVEGQGRVALKTSPSGGARHSIEAYVCALDVEGLDAGAYHYDAEDHALVTLGAPVGKADVVRWLAGQKFYEGASAIVVMCPVFPRAMWRYPFSRAYRAVLIEAGHLGQTFCLLATEMGLAPFCTMAMREQEIERVLGLDGVAECPVYVVGVGVRADRFQNQPGHVSNGSTDGDQG